MELRVRLLGGFGVTVDGRRVPEDAWRQRRGAQLVKLLALADRHRLTREQVVAALWPDRAGESGAANVRKAAHRARQSVGVDDGVVLDGGLVSLAPGHDVTTDVEQFRAAAEAALDDGDVSACRAAAGVYGGDLLPDERYADWCAEARRHLRRQYLLVLAGGQLWGRLVEEDPTDERAHRAIIRAHLEHGDRAAAIRQFEHARQALRDHLGLSPDAETVALYEQVLDVEGPQAPTPRERARALLAWGVVHWERSDLAEAARTATEARALAIDAGLGPELSDASELLGLVAYAQGNWRELFGHEFVQTVRDTPELAPFVHDAHMCMAEFALREQNGVTAVNDLGTELLAAADELDHDQPRALGLLLRGEATLVSTPRPDRAIPDLEAAATLHERLGSLTGLALAVERQAQVADAHDAVAAARLHRRALELGEESPATRHLVPFVFGGMLAGLDGRAAADVVAEGEDALDELDVCDPCALDWYAWAARSLARVDQVDAARGHLDEAERIAGMWSDGPSHHAVAEATAAVRLAEGTDPADVATLLHSAADGYASASRPRDETRCRQAMAPLA